MEYLQNLAAEATATALVVCYKMSKNSIQTKCFRIRMAEILSIWTIFSQNNFYK